MIKDTKLPIGEIWEACNGYEALSILQSSMVRLLITDIRMPKMDGLELIKEAKELGMHNLQIAIISGYKEFDYAHKAINLGVTHYLLKPIRADDLFDTLTQLINKLDRKDDSLPQHGNIDHYIIRQVVSYINKNFSENISLSSISERFEVQYNYLSSLFHEQVGVSFKQYLKNIRIEYAKELLLNTNMRVNEIAYRVGYNDEKYFARIFKQQFGVAPSDMRKNF